MENEKSKRELKERTELDSLLKKKKKKDENLSR